jgi:phosphatidylglycerol lysyltransferase
MIDIGKFLKETVNDKWWRWQKNRAAKSGYSYELSLPPHSRPFLVELEKVSNLWLTKNNRKERAFALGYFDKQYLQKCPVHYLKNQAGEIAAFTNQLPNFRKSDTVTIDLLRHSPDADHSMSYLLYKTIENLAGQYKHFDLGFVPFASTSDPVIAIARSLSVGRFSARGLEQFKNKFDPIWQPNYLAYDGDLADLALVAVNLERVMEPDL